LHGALDTFTPPLDSFFMNAFQVLNRSRYGRAYGQAVGTCALSALATRSARRGSSRIGALVVSRRIPPELLRVPGLHIGGFQTRSRRNGCAREDRPQAGSGPSRIRCADRYPAVLNIGLSGRTWRSLAATMPSAFTFGERSCHVATKEADRFTTVRRCRRSGPRFRRQKDAKTGEQHHLIVATA